MWKPGRRTSTFTSTSVSIDNLKSAKMKITIYLWAMVLCYLPMSLIAQPGTVTINVQGSFKNSAGEAVSDRTEWVTFRLYDSPQAGNLLWEESDSLKIRDGFYNHDLGFNSPLEENLFNDGQVYLETATANVTITPRSEITAAAYAVRANHAGIAENITGCLGGVGQIKLSVLPPDLFTEVNGDCWVLLQQRTLAADTRLKQLLPEMDTIPEGRGAFFRAFDPTGQWDPERGGNPQAVGSYQADTFQSHSHGVSDPGHKHNYLDSRNGSNQAAKWEDTDSEGLSRIDFRAEYADEVIVNETRATSTDSTDVVILATGDIETRPKNINLYAYIRIY